MTEPPHGQGPSPSGDFPPPQGYYPPPGNHPPPGYYPPPGGYSSYPPPSGGPYWDPAAPYGRDPVSGQPLSDKSKVVAGLLQLIGLFGVLGIGRFYLGNTGLGLAQLLVGLLGGFIIGMLTCGLGFAIPVIWAIVDAVLIFSGNVRDPQGRPLRDGT